MRDSEYTANEHMANTALRTAAAVIDAGIMQRWEQEQRERRRRDAGCQAIGMLKVLVDLDLLPECHRPQAQRLIEEWER